MTRATQNQKTVLLQLRCDAPPVSADDHAQVVFGLQDRQQAIHPGQAHADGSVSYEIPVAATYRAETGAVRFSGPCVHGTPAAPFLYLGLKRAAAGPAPWIRRLKIPLSGLTRDQLEAAPADSLFTARISGTGSGTVPLLGESWTRQGPTNPASGTSGS